MVRERDLMEILEAEEQKSAAPEAAPVVAEKKTVLEHVSGILEEYCGRIRLGPVPEIEAALTAAYFGRPAVEGQDGLKKILLAEAAKGVLNRQYDPRQSLAQLAVSVAADVYQDLFSTLCQQTYLVQRKPERNKREKVEAPEPEDKTLENYLAPVEPMLAATHYLKTVEGFEDAVMRCEDRDDLCAVAGAKTYCDILPTKTGKDAILAEAKNPATQPVSLFLYSVMVLHKEFLNHFESGGDAK